jgi:hypothetical protein
MAKQVFRQSALDKLATPEELDSMIQVTRLRGWLALVGLASLVVLALLWGIFGTIPSTMKTSGVLVRQDGLRDIRVPSAGRLVNLNIRPGDQLKENQVVGSLQTEQGQSELRSPNAGVVLEVPVENNQLLENGALVASLEMTDKPLQGVFFVPLSQGKSLQPGLKVQISPSTVPPQENGYLLGTISYVSALPVSPQGLYNRLKNQSLADALTSQGLNLEVDVNLTADPGTFSKLKWTSGAGPRLMLTNGTLCLGEIYLSEQHPINLVLPVLGGDKK